MAFNVHHSLTHDVVNHNASVLVEGDVELIDSRIRIEVHACVVAHLFFHTVIFGEEFGEVKGEGLVEVVIWGDVTASTDDV